MKVTELIRDLEAVLRVEGDLDVVVPDANRADWDHLLEVRTEALNGGPKRRLHIG
jgi:predicted SAM-dependent methyltransferase